MHQNTLIRSRDLAKMLSVSRATLWRMEKRGELPPKIQITSKLVGWKSTDIANWLTEREIPSEQPSLNSNAERGGRYVI